MTAAPAGFDLPERVGRYQIGPIIGVGGFAVVVRAYDEGLATDVAIKVLHRSRALDPEVRERFVREARLLRRVRDPAVVSVHDVGETPDGLPFFVMDLAAGGVLQDRLGGVAGAGPPHPDDLRVVVTTLAAGLGALHGASVVHRDVKPSNLLVLRDPHRVPGPLADVRQPGRLLAAGERLAIGDLGLAKDQDATALGPTMVGGTPRYHAPEQMQVGAPVDARTDVYAATAVLWRVLTGQPPPTADELPVAMLGVPEAWRPILARGLAARPDDRFPSMAEWAASVLGLLGEGAPTAAATANAAAATATAVPAGGTCPYKGLAAFQPIDAPLFFGRSELVDQLVARLQGRSALVVGGPSGSGKSSLLRAGLLQALAGGALPGSGQWASCLLTPGAHPLAALQARLAGIDGAATIPDLGALRANPALARFAVATPAVVVVDQLEELFTSCPDRDEREAFLAVLEALAREDPPVVRVVLGVRADFYGECAAQPWLASVINDNHVLVGPMSRSQLRMAIEGPARRVGLRLEDGLADRILDDAGDDAGTLPLVAHALVETWVRRQGTLLTVAGYEAAGGVSGAIGRTADHLWDRLDPAARPAARRLLLRLVRPGDGTPDTRRLAPWSELGDDPLTAGVVATFADGRLLTVDERGVEIAHEALIRTWARLATWLDESRDELRARERIEAAAREWERQGQDPGLLYRGTPLASALEWRVGLADGVPAGAAAFLAAAEAARDEEGRVVGERQERSRRVRRRAVSALAGLAGLALVASAIAFVALGGSRRDARAARDATRQATAQLAGNLSALSSERRDRDPFLATMLAAEGLAVEGEILGDDALEDDALEDDALEDGAPSAEARRALVDSRVALGGDRLVPYGDPVPVGDALTVVVDPAGRRAVTGNRNGTLVLWDLAGRTEIARLTGPRGGIQEAAFAPDGSWLVAASDDGGVWRWGTGAALGPEQAGNRLADLGAIVWSVAVSPDGRTVAAATQAGQVWLLDAATGAPEGGGPVASRNGDFDSVAFAPDGGSLLAGTGNGEVHVWSLPSRDLRFPLIAAHASEVWELLVHPTRPEFLTVSSDGTVRLWDLGTGARLPGGPYDGEAAGAPVPAEPAGATFADGGRLVTLGGRDGRVSTWSLDERRFVATAGDPSDAVIDGSRSADGATLVTLGADQSIRVWLQAARPGPSTQVAGTGAALFSVSVAAAGDVVAVGTGDGDVLVLDAASGEERARLGGHHGRVFALAFAGAGRLLTGDDEGTLREWDWEAGRVERSLPGAHEGAITALAVSEDHGLVASAGSDRVVRMWDIDGVVARGDPLGPLTAPLTDVAVSADARTVIASAADGTVGRWSTSGGGRDVGAPFQAEDNTVWAVAVSPDGRTLAAATGDEVVSLWSLAGEGQPVRLREVGGHAGGALDVVFLDRWTIAVTSRSGDVRLWDVASGQPLGPPLVGARSAAWHMAAAADSTVWVATQAGAVIRVDALVRRAACDLAAASFDSRQRQRFLAGQESRAC